MGRGNDKTIALERPPIVERAMLARLALPGDLDGEIEDSLEELRQLTWTAGAEVVATFVQHRETHEPGRVFGRGKLDTIKAAAGELAADLLIVDGDLTPNQGANLEDYLGCKVVDRTQLILDIFAQHAHTREGKLQVELAQLQYILPRLTGRGSIMRQQGGIGVRGPGEQKLEIDRRRIRERIQRLEGEIEHLRNHRRVQRKRRSENTTATVALVGYTNAGKSSLLNALTGSHVLVEDKLFATLDPRVRRCGLPSGREILLADTVGFVRKLPHQLVAAFRATLEEVAEAGLLLHVVDASHPAQEEHSRAVHTVLEEIGVSDLPLVKVYNKIDRLTPEQTAAIRENRREVAVAVSAKTGAGLDTLLAEVDQRIAATRQRLRFRIPQGAAGLVARLHASGRVLHEEYTGETVLVEAEVDAALAGQLRAYVCGEDTA